MKTLKNVLLSIISMVLGIGIIFFIQLFLNSEEIKLLMGIIFLVFILLGLFSMIRSITGKATNRKFIKSGIEKFLFIFTICIIVIGGIYISIYNIAMHEVFGRDITFSQKVEKFKGLNKSIAITKDYNNDISSYIEKLNKEDVDYISIYYDEKIDKEYIETIKETIPLAEKLTQDIYGDLERDSLKIIFYSDISQFKFRGFESDLVQGFFDGDNIHIKNFLKDQPLWHVEEHFIHEYSHYAFSIYLYQNNILKPLPTWFDEGIAEYTAVYEKNRIYSLDYLRNPVDLRKLSTTEDFMNSFGSDIGTEDFYDPYIYSYYMIDSLVDLRGKEFITDIILKSKERDFYEAFEEIVGVSIEEYQKVNLVEYINEKIAKSNI